MRNNPAVILANAEREIGSFYQAVLLGYGADEANTAMKDWLDIAGHLEPLPDEPIRYWRQVTILAADRLASRICCSQVTRLGV